MSRNNDDRLGAKPTDEAPVAATEVTPGPTTSETPTPPGQGGIGLNFAVPTEFVELPSKGHFYNPGHPLYNAETVEIRHMTAREEDILASSLLCLGCSLMGQTTILELLVLLVMNRLILTLT